MHKLQTLAVSVAVCAAALTLARAAEHNPSVSVLRGDLLVQKDDLTWAASDVVPEGKWAKSASSKSTLRANGLAIRVEEGAAIRLTKTNSDSPTLEAKGGRVFVHVDAGRKCNVRMPGKEVVAQQSEFIVDAGKEEKLYVLKGDAGLVDGTPRKQQLKSWLDKNGLLALDGPDVRRRAKNRRRFTQGEENKGKRIGEDLPPSTSPTAAPETPAYTPTPSPTVTAQPTASPSTPPTNTGTQPTVTGGGVDILPIVLGAGGAVGLGLLISNNVGNDGDDNVIINRPASP